MKLEEAQIIIHDALVCAIEDSIGEGDEAKKIDEAWLLILDHLEWIVMDEEAHA